MQLIKKYSFVLLVILLPIFTILPLTHSGFYSMHDDEQIARLFDLNQAVLSGNIPPRIVPNLGFGYGYAFFNYYPPLAYYVGEAFHLVGFSYILSTKLMLVTGIIFSALFMYFLTKEFFGRWSGVVASTAYTYSSYHAIDMYVRGAFAEFFAFVFIPLIFWATYKVAKTKQYVFVVIGALGVAGLILSHNLVAFMSTPFIGMWILYCLYLASDKVKVIYQICALFILGFGLSAYFFLPSYFERGYTIINILTSELANYSLHFVCVYQLWDSPWGYGGSIPGCYDGISFEIGKIQIILSVIAFLLSSYFLVSKKEKARSIPVLIFAVFLLVNIFMMVKFSKPVWDMLSPLWYIQFPWRFLLTAAFAGAFLSGAVIGFIKNNKLKILASVIIIISLISLNLFRFAPERYINVGDEKYVNQNTIRWDTSSLAYEYVPNGIKTKKSAIGTTLVAITKSEVKSESAIVISGKMDFKTVLDLPAHKLFTAQVLTPSVFQINTYFYPGWTVFLDGSKISYNHNNKLKLLQLQIPIGNHTIEAKFLDTTVRTIGNTISIISIILLVVSTVVLFKKYRTH